MPNIHALPLLIYAQNVLSTICLIVSAIREMLCIRKHLRHQLGSTILPLPLFNYCSHFPRSQTYSTLNFEIYIQENINDYGT
jgi:hypothetical protein